VLRVKGRHSVKRSMFLALAGALVFGIAGYASANTISLSGGGLAASADFEASGGVLTITLTNAAGGDVDVPSQVLTALFWDAAGQPSLTRGSVVIGPGSAGAKVTTPAGPGYDVSNMWAYKSGLSSPAPASNGVSASGFNLFGTGDLFSLDSSKALNPGDTGNPPDGLAGGLVPSGYKTAGDNGGMRSSINDSVVITFGYAGTYNVDAISNVTFWYGTSAGEGSLKSPPTVPLPAAIWGGMSMLGMLGVGSKLRKRLHR